MKFSLKMLKELLWKGEKLKKDQLLILFLTGVLLLVITVPAGKEKENGKTVGSRTGQSVITDRESYTKEMEQELEEMLSQMDGAGEVKVMLTLASTAEKVIEKDRDTQSEQVKESDHQGGERTTDKDSLSEETVYKKQNSNGDSPYVTKELTPQVEGVVVLATGGDNPEVAEHITEAVQALFGIDTHKIRIMKKNQKP